MPAPLVLLAPSEAKSAGGEPGILAESPAQAWVRKQVQARVRRAGPEELSRMFGVKDGVQARAEALELGKAVPLRPALERYTGVAFQALQADRLDPSLWRRVWLLSTLRGLVRGDEPLPPYKLKLGSLPGLRDHWKRHLPGQLAALPEGTVWDLLPEDHSALLRGWARPRHTLEIRSARGVPVSHAAKLFRGTVAGWLLRHGQGDPAKVLKGRIDGCAWLGMADNRVGGVALHLEVP